VPPVARHPEKPRGRRGEKESGRGGEEKKKEQYTEGMPNSKMPRVRGDSRGTGRKVGQISAEGSGQKDLVGQLGDIGRPRQIVNPKSRRGEIYLKPRCRRYSETEEKETSGTRRAIKVQPLVLEEEDK